MLLIEFSNKAAVREVLDKGPRLGGSRLFEGVFVRGYTSGTEAYK